MSTEWVKLELDLTTFDAAPFTPAVDQVLDGDITVASLDQIGDTPANRFRMYELNAQCSADIPNRGQFHSWEDYQRLRLDISSFDPGGVVIARRGDEWIGMASMSVHPAKGYLFTEMTGVVRNERRRGLALALKVINMTFGQSTGLCTLRTIHHPANAGIITLNRRLGYVDADWPYPS